MRIDGWLVFSNYFLLFPGFQFYSYIEVYSQAGPKPICTNYKNLNLLQGFLRHRIVFMVCFHFDNKYKSMTR